MTCGSEHGSIAVGTVSGAHRNRHPWRQYDGLSGTSRTGRTAIGPWRSVAPRHYPLRPPASSADAPNPYAYHVPPHRLAPPARRARPCCPAAPSLRPTEQAIVVQRSTLPYPQDRGPYAGRTGRRNMQYTRATTPGRRTLPSAPSRIGGRAPSLLPCCHACLSWAGDETFRARGTTVLRYATAPRRRTVLAPRTRLAPAARQDVGDRGSLLPSPRTPARLRRRLPGTSVPQPESSPAAPGSAPAKAARPARPRLPLPQRPSALPRHSPRTASSHGARPAPRPPSSPPLSCCHGR